MNNRRLIDGSDVRSPNLFLRFVIALRLKLVIWHPRRLSHQQRELSSKQTQAETLHALKQNGATHINVYTWLHSAAANFPLYRFQSGGSGYRRCAGNGDEVSENVPAAETSYVAAETSSVVPFAAELPRSSGSAFRTTPSFFLTRTVLAFVYGSLLKEALENFNTRWNSHRMRQNRTAGCPPGMPNDLNGSSSC